MIWFFRILSLPMIILGIAAFRPSISNSPSLYISSFENVLGTSFNLKIWASSETSAGIAEKAALDEIDRLSSILSSYDSASECSLWQKTIGRKIKVSPEFFEVLFLFDKWRKASNGALDAASGEVIKIWKKAEKIQQLPSDKQLENTVYKVNQLHWQLDNEDKTATHLSSVPLLFNSFVKSYIIHKVAKKVMGIEGLTAAVVNIGGDIEVIGDHLESIKICNPIAVAENDPPIAILQLSGKAIATSGDYRRGYSINGNWYSHIVDPRTAMPVKNVISATVVAPSATDAGALATAFNILPDNEVVALAASIPGVEFLVIRSDGSRLESKGWDALCGHSSLGTVPIIKKPSVQLQKPWKTDYEVVLSLELMRFEGRSHRPYVAIWVENSKNETVRTLALWLNKPRWLPDLKEWFRKNKDVYINGPTDVYSISSATRAAGAYTLRWDGKDDKGEYVKSDIYTFYIEIAREHGTYQLIKQEIACKNKAQEYTLPVNPEINAASIEYRKNVAENN